MFVDRADIQIASGNGGNGCNSFLHVTPTKKKPNGGRGGNGGDIIFLANPNLRTLYDFQLNKIFKAHKGSNGSSNNKAGRNGEDLIINVPVGTLVIDKNNDIIVKDLREPFQKFIALKGGKGGRGNSPFRSSQTGEKGEIMTITLELKLIADIGIIGYPNSGKSTLINAMSNTHSRVGNFYFTTKKPILGTVFYEDKSIVIADIPGLIEDAHCGRGLGTDFLKHIERTKMLIHVVDVSDTASLLPIERYKTINNELKLYDKNLMNKKQFIVANKIDLLENDKNITDFSSEIKTKVYPVSAIKKNGIKELIYDIFNTMYEFE